MEFTCVKQTFYQERDAEIANLKRALQRQSLDAKSPPSSSSTDAELVQDSAALASPQPKRGRKTAATPKAGLESKVIFMYK
jgi:hypothetical protein